MKGGFFRGDIDARAGPKPVRKIFGCTIGEKSKYGHKPFRVFELNTVTKYVLVFCWKQNKYVHFSTSFPLKTRSIFLVEKILVKFYLKLNR